MGRNQGNIIRFPGHYRHDLLKWRMSQMGFTPNRLAAHSLFVGPLTVHEDTVWRALEGECGTIKKLWAIAEILNLDFSYLFNFDLRTTEFDRAVLSRKAVRSSGSAVVGVSQARSVKRGGTYTRETD